MRTLIGLITIAALNISAISSPSALEQARWSFPEAGKNETALNRVKNNLGSQNNTTSKAYLGAFIMMSAEHTSYPLRKYNRFVKGRDMLEASIKSNKQNAELRYVRFVIQSNIPSFLNYSDKMKSDLDFFIRNKAQFESNPKLYKRMRANLKKIDNLPKELRLKIEKL